MATRVVINQPALGLFFRESAGAQAALAVTAEAYKNAVEEASPTGTSLSYPWRRPIRHGWFKRSLVARKFRHYWRVESTDPFAWLVEYGSGNNPPYSPFRRCLRRFGGIEGNPYRSAEP